MPIAVKVRVRSIAHLFFRTHRSETKVLSHQNYRQFRIPGTYLKNNRVKGNFPPDNKQIHLFHSVS